jgi:hypothetical protein
MSGKVKVRGFESLLARSALSQAISTSHLVACSFKLSSSALDPEASASKVTRGFLKLAIPLLLLIQKLSNLALQLGNVGLVAGIPLIQLFGHIH